MGPECRGLSSSCSRADGADGMVATVAAALTNSGENAKRYWTNGSMFPPSSQLHAA